MIPSEMINIPLSAEKLRSLTEPIRMTVISMLDKMEYIIQLVTGCRVFSQLSMAVWKKLVSFDISGIFHSRHISSDKKSCSTVCILNRWRNI